MHVKIWILLINFLFFSFTRLCWMFLNFKRTNSICSLTVQRWFLIIIIWRRFSGFHCLWQGCLLRAGSLQSLLLIPMRPAGRYPFTIIRRLSLRQSWASSFSAMCPICGHLSAILLLFPWRFGCSYTITGTMPSKITVDLNI